MLIVVLLLTSPFIWLNFSNSLRITEYSESEILLSSRAFETRSLIELSFPSAIVLIFACFSCRSDSIRRTLIDIRDSAPAPADKDTTMVAASAATTELRKVTPNTLSPEDVRVNKPPNASTTLTLFWYFYRLRLSFHVLLRFPVEFQIFSEGDRCLLCSIPFYNNEDYFLNGI